MNLAGVKDSKVIVAMNKDGSPSRSAITACWRTSTRADAELTAEFGKLGK
ncbi:hypothetical protein [Bradyrhizobium retamae]|nr:hypothetical protein [Bradyrhizobium retamae]